MAQPQHQYNPILFPAEEAFTINVRGFPVIVPQTRQIRANDKITVEIAYENIERCEILQKAKSKWQRVINNSEILLLLAN
jgi:hypothetical protein